MKKFNYENTTYLTKLNALSPTYYSKYIKCIQANLPDKKAKFLDVGFGSGTVLQLLIKQGFSNGYGVDISKIFIAKGKKQGLKHIYYYDGVNLPFKNNSFDVIGSFNVLEHTENPEKYLKEQIQKLKNGGKLIIACPNFLSVLFPSYHRRLKGPINKFANFLRILQRIFFPTKRFFEKMPPIIQKEFQYDDDAIVVTNLIDTKRFLKRNSCTIIYESGFINFDTFIYRLINTVPFMRYMLPSCFVIAEKSR